MNIILAAALTALGLFGGILLLLEIGRRIGVRQLASDGEGARAGTGAVEGAVFGLMGLLIAFTFSGAAGRFDTRRQQVTEEANNIGTAWLRLDLLPAGAQPVLRESFRRYVDARLDVYRQMPDVEAAQAALVRTSALQSEIWTQAVAACREGPPSVAMLLLPALNQMFDITTTRTMAMKTHTPVIIFLLLVVLTLVGALLAGYGMAPARTRSWVHMLGFAFVTAAAVYLVLDLEFPRMGMINIHAADRVLVELRQSMK
jgi:heme/copper-type cytochrome/quinol oxidase subunit 4